MELHILWLYHDIKDVFGDKGNIQVLKKRCRLRNIDCIVTTCGIDENIDMSLFDFVYFGTNIDYQDTYILQDLTRHKENIQHAIGKGVFFFLVNGGFAVFGKEYQVGNEIVPALDILDYTSIYKQNEACIGNAYVATPFTDDVLIGFENHRYQIIHNRHPLGKVLMGKGNNVNEGIEGYFHEHIMGTNLHGPLLPKNPAFADKILEFALSRQYPNVIIEPLEDIYEEKARAAFLKRLKMPN